MSLFLSKEETAELCGTKIRKRQVAWLRKNSIRFYVNAAGRAIVPKSAIEGVKSDNESPQGWQSNLDKIA